ncbi:MAG: TonB-dependent receptor domain-containing protein, partial [Syntrophothermus sp.]
LKSKEPVSFAHVCFEGLIHKTPRYALTSIEGTCINPVTEKSRIIISYVGYTTYDDVIEPGQSVKIALKPGILNMQEVVVTAQYAPEKADRSIYKIDVISHRQIEAKAATNLTDLLRSETNLKVQSNGVLGSSLEMQGLSGENIKILLDGVPMIGRMNGNFDLSQLNLHNIDHVEVIEGPMSVIYGSNALAGAINLISRENSSTTFSSGINTLYETVGQYNFAASVSGNVGKHGYSLDGGRNFFDGFNYHDTSRAMTFKPTRQYFFDGYYLYSPRNMKLKIGGDYFNELLQDKGPLLPAYYETAIDHYYSTIRYSGRADYSWHLSHQHYINGVLSYSAYDRKKQTYSMDMTTLQQVESTSFADHDTTGIRSLIGRATYSRNDSTRNFNYQTGIDVDVEKASGKRIADNHQQIGDYAGFLSLKWEPWKKISVQPGARFIYNTKYPAPLVYALSIRYEPFPRTSVRFSYARGFRAPDIKQLYMNFVDVNHDIQGNPDLKAEQSHNVNLNLTYGAERNSTAYSFSLTGFFNAIQNHIELASTGAGITSYTYININQFQTTGVEGSATVNLYPALRLQAGISTTGKRGSVGEEMVNQDFIFSTDYTLNASYRFNKPDFTISGFYKHSGKSTNVVALEESTAYYTIDPYNTLDLTLLKGFWKSRLKVSAGVKNIFNVKSVPSTGETGGAHSGGGDGTTSILYGRSFFIGLAFNFNQYK